MAQMGDLITFDYQMGKKIHDRTPKVLVLHPNWQGQMHGLNFNYLTEQEINYIKAVLNPIFESEIVKKDRRIAIQMTRVRSIVDTLNITSPHDFYVRFVRGFIQPRGWDPYRRYLPERQRSLRIITASAVMTGDQREKGIFHKALDKIKHFRGGLGGQGGVLPGGGRGLGGQGGVLPGQGPLGGGKKQ